MSTADPSSKNIKVAVRVRPLNGRELEQNQRSIIRVEDPQSLTFDPDEDEDEFFFHGTKQNHRDITKRINKKLLMEFDEVFGNDSDNLQIFETCMKPLVTSVMGGYNGSVFVYGATGAGKTHTMLGNDDNPGITYLTMEHLFDRINELSVDRKFDIGISYLEVYNEQVMNLLTKSGPLKLREDSAGVVVGNLSLMPIYNAGQLLNLLSVGNRNRTQHPTDANAESSRSHAIFQVHIRMTNKKTNQKNTVKLSMIDLAGSERAASTKCMGTRFKEGASINKSLLALGNCINKLADGAKHIPYRDSNLTRIIKDSLGGNCQTVMIANVSPSSLTYEDTYNTLKYASRAKNIRTNAKLNICKNNMPKDVLLRQLSDKLSENEMIKLDNERLKNLVKQLEQQNESNAVRTVVVQAENGNLELWYDRIDTIYEELGEATDQYYSMVSKEKLLKLRTKLKEKAEESMRILILDGSDVNSDLIRMQASVDRFGKQIVQQQDTMNRLKTRLNEKLLDLKKLRQSVRDSGLESALERYFFGKDNALEVTTANIKIKHYVNLLHVQLKEDENNQKSLLLGTTIIQQNYLLLRATNSLDNKMKANLERFKKSIQGQREVKFVAEGEMFINNEYANLTMIDDGDRADAKRLFEEVDSYAAGSKAKNRKLFEDSTVMGPPKAVTATTANSLNETHVIAKDVDDDDIGVKPLPIQKKMFSINDQKPRTKVNTVRSILTDNALYSKVNRITTKSTVPARLNKENKRFSPVRVAKSPNKARTPKQTITRPITAAARLRTKTSTSQAFVSSAKKKINIISSKR